MRKLWSYLRFRVRLHSRLAMDVGLALAGLLLIAAGGHAWIDIGGWVVSGMGLMLFARDLRERWRRHQQTRIAENEDYADLLARAIFPKAFELYSGNIIRADHGKTAGDALTTLSVQEARPYITDHRLNWILDSANNPIRVLDDKYEVPERLRDHQARCVNRKKPQFNDPKVGLRTDITTDMLEDGRAALIQYTDYFSGTATNEVACDQFELAKPNYRGAPTILVAVSDMVVTGGKLVGLAESELSNHIGVSTLVLSGNDEIILQDQGEQCVYGNETAVGASGSLDFRDLERLTGLVTLQSLCRYGMEREAREELSAKFARPGQDTILTGYARYLTRGGKPEFFGISRSASNTAEMAPIKADRKFVSGIRGIPFPATAEGLVQVIDGLLRDGATRRRYSLSMVVCLRLSRDWIERANESDLARLMLRKAVH